MSLQLRPYQQEALDAVYNHLRRRDDNPCVVLPTGSGKTPLLAQICHDVVTGCNGKYRSGRILVLSHVKELLEQAANHLASFLPIDMVGLHSAGLGRRDTTHPVIVAGIQTVYNIAGDMGAFDLILVDECFPAGTLVKTPGGDVAIECLRTGQPVCTAMGIGEIEAMSTRCETEFLEIHIDNGERIVCTRNHPFFTHDGWLEAWRLEEGAHLFCYEDMRLLRENIPTLDEIQSGRKPTQLCTGKALGKANVLLDILLQEKQECNEGIERTRGTEAHPEDDAAQTDQAGWKRPPPADTSTGIAPCLGTGLGGGICDSNRHTAGKSDSKALQDRYSESGAADRDRTGWGEPYGSDGTSSGHPENSVFGSKRVVRIAHVKQDRPTPVFNLHISGHPSYYAGGVLVHNCHLLPESGEGRYLTFLRDAKVVNPRVRIIGLTATPFRLNSGVICKPGNMLNHICYEADVKRLILDGWLCPLRTRRGMECANLDNVKIASTGDFASDEMQAAFESIIKPACAEIMQLCADRHSVLVFAAGIDHAHMVAEALGGEVVTGKTTKEERAAIISRFRAGEFKYLVNVNVLTTGFDAPNVDAVVLLRATLSAGLYVQMVGRGLRKHADKADCLILDYGDNAVRHGPIDRVEVVERGGKKGKADEAPGKECPNCHEVIAVQYRICPNCDFEFPANPDPRHNRQAGDAPILSDEAEMKEVEVLEVRYAENVKHKEDGASVTFRVEYILNRFTNQMVREFLCFNHPPGNFAKARAEAWWREHSAAPVPSTVMDAVALARKGALANTRKLTLVYELGNKYPEIVGRELDDIPAWDRPDEADDDFFAHDPTAIGAQYDPNEIPF